MKLDVLDSTIEGLKNEMSHMSLEVRETRELQKIYEVKCTSLMEDINRVSVEF